MTNNREATFSIITPNYNQSRYLMENINSIKNQHSVDVEHIIIDGLSNDNFQEIIEHNLPINGHIVCEKDSGQSDAINKGIRIAKGNIINWLNADDYYEPNALKKVVGYFDDKRIKIVCGKSNIINEKGTIKISRGTDIYQGNLAKTIGWARIDQPETFFRGGAWEKVGFLNEALHYTMDREWWMRYLYHFGLEGIQRTNDILVNFRLHEASKTGSEFHNFQIEHDTLFYLMAFAAKSDDIKKLIAETCAINDAITSEIKNWKNVELSKKSLNYYLLKRADEFYYASERHKASVFFQMIESDWLARGDQALYKKLKLRLKIPSAITHFFRS